MKKNIIHSGLIIENGCGYIDPNHERNVGFITEMKKLNHDNTNGIAIVEPLRLFVILQKFDVQNKNGRIYPEYILRREAKRYQELIDNRQALGENEHPDSSIINSKEVAIEIKKIWFEGQTLVGELELIMSPAFVKYGIISCEGDRIANFLRLGIRIGVSSRGVGSIEQRGDKLIVQDDFELICWDVVVNPSTPGAYIFPDAKQSRQFKESVDEKPIMKDNKKSLLESKLNNFLKK